MKKNLFDNSNLQEPIEWGNIPVGGMTDEELHSTNWNRGAALIGRKRPDQSERMSGENNPMAGKEHPNKGKELPQIGRLGQKKPEGFGEKVSKAKKGVPNDLNRGRKRPQQSILMSGANNPMCKPIKTPFGVFDSIKYVIADEKSRGLKNADRIVRRYLKDPNSGYYYLDK
jgi:hypothetical protein